MVTAEIGLSPNPAVYYKLGDISGDLTKGPLKGSYDNIFYKGDISIYHDAELLASSGILSIFSDVNWVGLGLDIAQMAIPIIASHSR